MNIFNKKNTIQQLPKRAESPIIISVGHRPTKRYATSNPKPQWGVIKMSPFQGLTEKLYPSNRALPYPNDIGLSVHCVKFTQKYAICKTKTNPNTLTKQL